MKLNGQEMYLFIGGQYDSHQIALDGLSKTERQSYIESYRPVGLQMGTLHTIVYVSITLDDSRAFDMLVDRYHDTLRK